MNQPHVVGVESRPDYMAANVAEGFDRTTTAVALTEARVLSAETEAYGRQAPGYQARLEEGESGFGDFFAEPGKPAPAYIDKASWNEEHPLYRKGVEWREEFTEARARIYAEDYDQRQERKQLLGVGGGQYGFFTGTLPGFFAGMLGSLPDPVNLIPFGGGLIRGKGALAGAKAGAFEGALSNFAVDALVLPDLRQRGEELHFADLALDLVFGAALGGGLGALGGWLGKRRADKMEAEARAKGTQWQAELVGQEIDRLQTHGEFERAGADRFFDIQDAEFRWQDAEAAERAAYESGLDDMAAADERRQAYIDNELNRAATEADSAANRLDSRMELVQPYREQLMAAGYSRAQADGFVLVLAANAERMAPLFGETPAQYLEKRLAGFMEMTPGEFEGLRHLDELAEEQAFAQMMADAGIKPGMGRVQKRRILQPEFSHAWGHVSPESVINGYGKSVYNDLRRQFGPGFFARKGQGVGLDVLAKEFQSEQRGGYFNAGDVDEAGFAEKVMMPHDEFETEWRRSVGGGLYQSAMYRSKANSVQEFVDYVLSNVSPKDKPFYHLAEAAGKPVELGYSPVQHISKRHPDFTEWERIPEVIEQGPALNLGKDFYSGGEAAVYVLPEGETALVTISSLKPSNKSGSHPERFIVLTAFRENTGAVNGWIAQRKERAATYSSAGGTPASSPAREGAALSNLSDGVESSIARIDDEVNSLLGKGEILEQRKNQGARGAIRKLDDGRHIVGLFKNRDASTVLHETGHFFMEQLREAARLETAPEWVKNSWASLEKAYGFDGFPAGENWTRAQERFAADFEAYTREGKAPAHELQTAFDQFKEWLTAIYRNIKKLLGDNELSPEVREVFDRLLASDEERAATGQATRDMPAGMFDVARMNVHGEARQALLNGMELAAQDVAAGRDVDVSQVAGLPEAITRASKAVSPDETVVPDFSQARPETFSPAPEIAPVNPGESANAALLREQGINPETGLSIEEIMIDQQQLAGREINPDALAELDAARDAEVSRQRIEERGYEMLACVTRVAE